MSTYNIMTSCDENLYRQVKILLYSVSKNLSSHNIDFYLFRRRGFSEKKLSSISKFAKSLSNITLHDVIINDVEKYDFLAAHGGFWTGEAYFSLCAHEYLPSDADRVLYLDAGDVIVTDEIGSFYSADFDDNVILASNVRTYRKDENNKLYPVVYFDEADIEDPAKRTDILGSTFNSGSYVMNLQKLRDSGLTIDDYVDFVKLLLDRFGGDTTYFGDQGFLSVCFLGDIKYFNLNSGELLYSSKYNFALGWYQLFPFEPPYHPSIVHFVGAPKPWTMKFRETLSLFPDVISSNVPEERLSGQMQWYDLWREYEEKVNSMEINL